MAIDFVKYQGTGNDFVLIDHRQQFFNKEDARLIARICDRRFGIGADGLILLEEHPEADFEMVYFNSDGNPSSMCGNGGRCIVHFAKSLGIIDDKASFMAVDGMHTATILENWVELSMSDVKTLIADADSYFLDTGSPHHVLMCGSVDEVDIQSKGAEIRYGKYGAAGANVNFVSPLQDGSFKVRTYERGVEAETLSCGTGVTAVALAMHSSGNTVKNLVTIETPGGTLKVSFSFEGGIYKNVVLAGPATPIFKGQWN